MAFSHRAFTLFIALALVACGGPDKELAATTMPPAPAAVGGTASWDALADLPWPQDGQTTFKTYDDARPVFWRKLYPQGGTELYCGIAFDGRHKTAERLTMSVEHAFPADAIAETEPGCKNRSCPAPRVQRAMADLQNLWPALGRVNSSRSNLRYGELPGEDARRYAEFCPDFERSAGANAKVEPRDEVKGDIARSLVYMHFVYGLPLENAVSDKDLLLAWMRADPPDAEEMRRNALIDQLHGAPNPLLLEAFMGM